MTRLFFIFFFIFSLAARGQEGHSFKPGDYIRQPMLDNFVGTWEWRSDSTIFTIVLQKAKVLFTSQKVYKDLMIGWHSFMDNGVMIESTLYKKVNTDPSTTTLADTTLINLVSIYGSGEDSAKFEITIKDITRQRDFYGILEIIPGRDGVATWRSVYQARSSFKPKINYPKFRTVPTDIVMRKIK